jgi:hypothetical protein
MFIRKWRTPEWAMLSIGFGLLLLVVILSLAPSAIAAPLQMPSGIQPCSAFPAEYQEPIRLQGTVGNDSCVVTFLDGCDLEVRLVVNATTSSPILSYKWVRRADWRPVNSHAKPKKYASTSADNYNYTRESQSSVVHLNAYYRWPLPDCKHPKKGKHDWFGTASVTIRTKKQRTVFGMASHNAGHIGDEIDGAVNFP